jgi:hypothetical protein
MGKLVKWDFNVTVMNRKTPRNAQPNPLHLSLTSLTTATNRETEFDFDRWASAVRRQMLDSLKKRDARNL